MKTHIIGFTLLLLSPALAVAQTTEMIVPHPALETVSDGTQAMHPSQQLGKFGESFVRENLRASGYEVYDANLNGHGIDLLAIRRDAQGVLIEVRPVEVKTRSLGTDFRLDMTRDGRQLSSEWIDTRLAKLAREHPDHAIRQLATEITAFKAAHPEQVHPQLHGLSIGDDVQRMFRVDPRTGAVDGLVSEGRVTRLLKRLSEAEVNPATRQAATRHLQQFDQIQASIPARAGTPAIAAELPATSAEACSVGKASQLVKGAEALPGASGEAVAAESSLLTKALPVAGKTLAVAGAILDVGVRTHQACQVEQQFQRGEISDRDRVVSHAKNGAGMAAGWGGAIALGSQGAGWGSALGPVGTVVGGVGGGIGGYLGGEKLAQGAVEMSSEVVYSGVNTTRTAIHWVSKQLESGASAARFGAEHASKQIGSLWNSGRSRLGW